MEEEPDKFELEIRNKEKGVFVDLSPNRIVLGPRSSVKKAGEDDHLTVVMNGDRIDQAHRKVDGKEVWHQTGEALQAHLDSLLANATETVNGNEFAEPNTYIVSVKRVKLLFSIVTLPFSVFMTFFWRLFADVEVSEGENGVNGRIAFKQSRILHLIQSAQPPLSLLARILQKVPPSGWDGWDAVPCPLPRVFGIGRLISVMEIRLPGVFERPPAAVYRNEKGRSLARYAVWIVSPHIASGNGLPHFWNLFAVFYSKEKRWWFYKQGGKTREIGPGEPSGIGTQEGTF